MLNNAGYHQPYALRSVIEVETKDGVVGLGESHGTKAVLDGLAVVVPNLVGRMVTDLNALRAAARSALGDDATGLLPRVVGAIEVAMWDALDKATGTRICDLLVGQVREAVPFAAYLFYKFGRHAGGQADEWGEVLSPEQLVGVARRMIELYGFSAIKLEADTLEPEAELAGLRALRSAFPKAPLRIDPNGGWRVETTLDLLPDLEGWTNISRPLSRAPTCRGHQFGAA